MADLDRLISDVLGAPPARGRRAQAPLMASVKRQLDRADIETLWEKSTVPSSPQRVSPIQRIRTSHHMLAKLVAEGRPHTECSLITGYSQTYISNIQHEPMFSDLVAYYKSQLGEVYLNVHQRLASLGMDVIDELQDRLNNDPDGFSVKDLEEVAKLTLDRAGYGPQSTVTHRGSVSMVTTDQLNRIKDEIERNQTGRTLPLLPQDNSRTIDGELVEGESVAEAKTEGIEGEGDNLSEQGGDESQGTTP